LPEAAGCSWPISSATGWTMAEDGSDLKPLPLEQRSTPNLRTCGSGGAVFERISSQGPRVFVADLAAGTTRRLSDMVAGQAAPVCTPERPVRDLRRRFRGLAGGGDNLWELPLEGGPRRQLTHLRKTTSTAWISTGTAVTRSPAAAC
jgi:hypothetical protein